MINFSGLARARTSALTAFSATIVLACGGAGSGEGDRSPARPESEGRLWVVAPHPDDEVLMAGERLRAAVAAARPHTVLVMTNGDLSCDRDGHLRQRETVEALAMLGVTEDHVRFLGYPDGWLDALGPVPLDPMPRTELDGSCGVGDHTYAERGAGHVDVHTARTGTSGAYVGGGPEEDLAALLVLEHPTEIVTSHGIDTHPDHRMTYVFVRRAIERAGIAPPRILRSLVHQGPCWPNGAGTEPCPDVRTTQGTAFPALAAPLDGYLPTLHLPSADGGTAKRAAIGRYVSQLGTSDADASWLSSFARTDEVYYPETLASTGAGTVERVDGCRRMEIHGGIDRGRGTTLDTAARLRIAVDTHGVASLELDERVIATGPSPHGEDPPTEEQTSHHYRVTIDDVPSDGPVVEVTVRRDGVLWMVAVVPRAVVAPDLVGDCPG